MGGTRFLVLGVVLAIAGGASAQTYTATSATAAYPALTSGTQVTLSGTKPEDNGRATLPLGFTFPFFDKTYTHVAVTANGALLLEPAPSPTYDYPANWIIPYQATPNGLIAVLWDDLKGTNAQSRVLTQAVTGPNGRGLAIEWSDWNHWASLSAYSLTFQARLWENGIVETFYGPMTGSGQPISASVGVESPNGLSGTVGKACTGTSTTFCTFADFAPNTSVTYGPPVAPDISVLRLGIDSIVAAGSDLQITTALRLRNFGQTAANGFSYRLFLSNNTTYEPSLDVPILPAPRGPVSLPPLAVTTHTVTGTVARPASGSYYVLAVVDDSGQVAESDENNNVGVTSTPLISGVDLVAEGISGPAGGGPGESITTTLTFSNQGIDVPPAAVGYKIWLSTDGVLGTTDHLVHSGSITVTGGQNVSQPVTFNLPNNVPSGDYLFALQLDDGPAVGAITEVSEGNNLRFSTDRFTSKQADLTVSAPRLLDPASPFAPATVAFFGEQIRVEAEVSNIGGASAGSFALSFHISDNDSPNQTFDPLIAEARNLSLAPGASQTIALTAPMPDKAKNGLTLVPGHYLVFAIVRPTGNYIEELPTNNIMKSGPHYIRLPAPDLVSTSLSGPTVVGAGEVFAITRTVRNIGNRPAGVAGYRVYLSANPIVTSDDLPLKIQTSSGWAEEGSVTLAAGEEDSAVDWVRVPELAPAARYYLGILVDPPGSTGTGSVAEISETNNGLAVQQLDVIGRPLGLASLQVPDGFVGMPFSYQLRGAGGDGTYAFAVQPETGTVPPGLLLEADGRLHGTPIERGVFAFTVMVTSGGRTAHVRLVLRIIPPTSSLTISTSALPPLVRAAPYEANLAAHGGSAPYRWERVAGALPAGLSLSEAGRISGLTTAAFGVTVQFTVRVRDSAGNSDVRELSLGVVDGSAITIVTSSLPAISVGAEYLVDVIVRNANGAPLSTPLSWSVVGGALPPGLALEPNGDIALLRGTPTLPGNFPFTLQVIDSRGRVDTADLVLPVYSSVVAIRGAVPRTVALGEAVEVQLAASNGDSARFSLHGGALPPGLAVSEDGVLSGTVSEQGAPGTYNFTVFAETRTGARGMAAFVLEVTAERPSSAGGCGCATDGSVGASALGLYSVLALLRRRGRSKWSK